MSQDMCLCGHGNTTAHSVRDRGCCRGLGVCRVKAYTYTCMFYIFIIICIFIWASQVALVVKKKKQKKNPPTNAGDIKDTGSIPGSGRTPGGGHGNPLQYACLENPMDRGARRNTVHRVAKSETQLK